MGADRGFLTKYPQSLHVNLWKYAFDHFPLQFVHSSHNGSGDTIPFLDFPFFDFSDCPSSSPVGSAFAFALVFGLGFTNTSGGAGDIAVLDADVFIGHSFCQCPSSPHFTHLLFFL